MHFLSDLQLVVHCAWLLNECKVMPWSCIINNECSCYVRLLYLVTVIKDIQGVKNIDYNVSVMIEEVKTNMFFI